MRPQPRGTEEHRQGGGRGASAAASRGAAGPPGAQTSPGATRARLPGSSALGTRTLISLQPVASIAAPIRKTGYRNPEHWLSRIPWCSQAQPCPEKGDIPHDLPADARPSCLPITFVVLQGPDAVAMVSESPGPGAGIPWRRRDEALHVNVGGVRRRLSAQALARFPGTRLGRLQAAASEEQARRLCDDYDAAAREFYFDRHPGFFLGLLHFYRTGHLHVLDELCVFAFGQEADYWGLGENALAACCRARYLERRVARPRAWDEDSDAPSSVDPCPDEISDVQRELARYGAARCGRLRRRLWLTMENPGYSLPSKLFSCVSIGVVLASIAAMCIHSLPEYQAREAAAAVAAVAAGRSAEEARDDPVLRRLEYFCIAWFSFEVSSRLLLAPSTRNFFCHPLNLIDIVSVLPFYLTLLAGAALGDRGGGGSGEELGDLGKVVQVFRLMRIFRVLKLARHSTGLRSLGATLKHSYREVGILLLYLAVGVSVFSGVAYTAEEENVGFDTIPACWWWGTVSMTTVGYGDVVPETVAGKLAASGCILGGILVVALPITIIFNKFSHFYRRQKALEAAVRSSGQREFEDLLSSVDGVSEASLETSRETSQEGRFADLETRAPHEPAHSHSY